jgi:hypothetical protein
MHYWHSVAPGFNRGGEVGRFYLRVETWLIPPRLKPWAAIDPKCVGWWIIIDGIAGVYVDRSRDAGIASLPIFYNMIRYCFFSGTIIVNISFSHAFW